MTLSFNKSLYEPPKGEKRLKGEIMGLEFDPTRYGMKDYAKELGEKYGQFGADYRSRLNSMGITVPIGQTTTAQGNVPAGLGVEKTETAEQSHEPSAQEVQENMNFKGESAKLNSARQLDTKKARKEAIEEVKNQYMKYGTSADDTPISEKQAKKMAKNYVENAENLENMYSTRTYVDKDAYKKAEGERKAEYKKLKKEYREQGMSRREAKRKAKSELVNNEYLDSKKARNFVQEHSEQFLDENGKLSQNKYKKFAFGLTNTHTEANETNNAHLSLKERREAAETHHTKAGVIRDMARSAGADVERDNTGLYRTLFVVGVTGAAAGVGAAVLPAVSAVSGSAAAAGAAAGAGAAVGAGTGAAAGAGASAAAGAGAMVTINGVGAVAGGATGLAAGSLLSGFLRDKGNKEPHIYEPGKSKQVQNDEVNPQPIENDDPIEVCQLKPDESHEIVQQEINYCTHKIIRGDDPYKIVTAKYRHEDGSRLSHAEALQIAHELKMIHGCKNYRDALNMKVGDEFRCYTEFDGLAHPELKGKKYVVDCDAETDGKSSKGPMKGRIYNFDGKYNGAVREHDNAQYYYVDCSNNRSNPFATASERDAAMAKRQAELDAAAGK